MMQAELKRLHSDIFDLEHYRPEKEAFGISVQALFGPKGTNGEESFGFTICTPQWFSERHDGEIILGLHYLIVPSYDYAKIIGFISKFASGCLGKDWKEVARKLSRLGSWEFEDYQP